MAEPAPSLGDVIDSLYAVIRARASADPLAAGSRTIGVILFTFGMQPPHVVAWLSRLAAFARPAAVFNEYAFGPGWSFTPPGQLVRLFGTATGPECGLRAARLLLELGHRRIAYLSPSHADGWSVCRLQGLQSVYGLTFNI